jgi:hypothetical protein
MGVNGQHHAPAALYPGERTAGTHWTGGWVGLRADLEAETGRKILCLCWGSNPGRPVRSRSLYGLNYRGYGLFLFGVISAKYEDSTNNKSFVTIFICSCGLKLQPYHHINYLIH